MRLALVLLLAGCSMSARLATGRPATTATLVVDFVIASVALAASTHLYNTGDTAASAALFVGAMAWATTASMSESR